MSASTKLSNSVKALSFLAKHGTDPQSSATISKNTGINASKIRKLFSSLAKKGIVTTIQGSSGGFTLARPPADIHLQEIYCAIEDRKAFHLDVTKLPQGDVGETAAINNYFLDLFSDIQVEIENKMKNISLANIANEINQNID